MIADLFQVSVKTANEHLVNIYEEGELDQSAAIRKFRIVETEGNREVSRTVDHYNFLLASPTRSVRKTQDIA